MARTIAIVNRKGGVGKTTTSVNLGAALANVGRRVLLVDMDPSGDLTNHVGVELQDGDATVYEVIANGADIRAAIRNIHNDSTGTDYDVIPADGALENLSDEPQERLRDALTEIVDDYDYIILDAQPTLGEPTAQVLTAADGVIIPTGANYLALDAVTTTAQIVKEAQQGLNPRLEIMGVLMTQYNPRISHQREIREAIAEMIPNKVYDIYTSPGTGVTEAAANGTDLYEYVARNKRRKGTRAVQQYKNLARAIIDGEG